VYSTVDSGLTYTYFSCSGFTDLKTPCKRNSLPGIEDIGHRVLQTLCLTTWKTLHTSPPRLSTCLNSFLTIFHPDPCVLPIQISLPDQPVLLATFPRTFSVSAPSTWNSLPAHIRSIDILSTFKRHVQFHLFQSAFTV